MRSLSGWPLLMCCAPLLLVACGDNDPLFGRTDAMATSRADAATADEGRMDATAEQEPRGPADGGTADAAPTDDPGAEDGGSAEAGARDASEGAGGDAGQDAQASDASNPLDAVAADADVEVTDGDSGDAATAEDASNADSTASDAGEPEELCGRVRCDCTFDGVELWGKVEVVDAFGDFKVREASFADLKVRDTAFPASCGEWDMVDAFGDFTIEFVTIGEDFTIEYSSFPGLGYPP